jgi:short stature homeobox protein
MEQLAYFVTKTFEYNNTTNRVLEIINMTTKFDEKSEKGDEKVIDECMDEDESVDIDITDTTSETEVKISPPIETEKAEKCDKSKVSDKVPKETAGLIERAASPLPLIKKLNRDGSKHVTKNWLISDCPKRKIDNKLPEVSSKSDPIAKSLTPSENQENSAINLIRVEDLVNKKHSTVRAKPVNELLKQIREINNQSPFHNTNENFKVEMEDERIKSGDYSTFSSCALISRVYLKWKLN